MDNRENICRKCARKIDASDTSLHAVRGGYSAAHFPLYHFEKVPLCPDCKGHQHKIDLFEKGLALLALGIVAYFMIIVFLPLFHRGA